MEKIIISKISHLFAVTFFSVLITVALSVPVVGESVSGTMESAKQAVRMRNYSKAASLFQILALKGEADAEYQLGVFFQLGRGVPKDHAKAIEWYKKASKQGHMRAQYNLGVMYENG
ncbi:MAG: sel1 repeat family protein, partial [Candidatus Scalindua sp.]|nr:sel1 repeat family protein [Candidatus Scalindua sp.]